MAYGFHLGINYIYYYCRFTTAIFIFSTFSISAGPTSIYYWGIFCLLGQTWGCGNCCYCAPLVFALNTWAFISLLPLSFSSSLLLFFQCLFKFVTLLYYCFVLVKVLDIVHTLLSKIWKEYLRSPELSNFTLSKNIENRAKCPLALAYTLYLHKSCRLHILDWELGT